MNAGIYILLVVAVLAIIVICCYAFIPSLRNRFKTKAEKRETIAKEEVALLVQQEPKKIRVKFKDTPEVLTYIEKKEDELGISFSDEEIPFIVEQLMFFDEIHKDE